MIGGNGKINSPTISHTKGKSYFTPQAQHIVRRLFLCGNQLGKTLAGGFEAAMHATGRYAPWWQGKRFDRPVVGWVCGVTGETARDTVPAGQGGRAAAQSQRTPLPNS